MVRVSNWLEGCNDRFFNICYNWVITRLHAPTINVGGVNTIRERVYAEKSWCKASPATSVESSMYYAWQRALKSPATIILINSECLTFESETSWRMGQVLSLGARWSEQSSNLCGVQPRCLGVTDSHSASTSSYSRSSQRSTVTIKSLFM